MNQGQEVRQTTHPSAMIKDVTFGDEAKSKILKGMNTVANAVKVTLGAAGRNVVIEHPAGGLPHLTKDGVTVANNINLEDPLEDVGAQIIKEAAAKTAAAAGDSTTTSTVLAQELVLRGNKLVAAGSNPIDIKRGMDAACEAIVELLHKSSYEIKDSLDKIHQVATISANNDWKIGELIGAAFEKVGAEGSITVKRSQSSDTSVNHLDGMEIKTALVSPYFADDISTGALEMKDPLVLLYDGVITSVKDIHPLLDYAINSQGRGVFIVCGDLQGEALSTLVVNKVKQNLPIAVVRAPSYGQGRQDIMEDMSVLLGGVFISEQKGMSLSEADVQTSFGACKRIVMRNGSAVFAEGAGEVEPITMRVEMLRNLIKEDPKNEEARKRLASLIGGIAELSVGANSEVELDEKLDRVDDALQATRAAIEEGYVAGGGVALIRAREAFGDVESTPMHTKEELMGFKVVLDALSSPAWQIAENAGVSGDVVVNSIKNASGSYGFNAKTLEYGDMVEMGIIDPTKSIRIALESAVSVAGNILITDAAITNTRVKGNE